MQAHSRLELAATLLSFATLLLPAAARAQADQRAEPQAGSPSAVIDEITVTRKRLDTLKREVDQAQEDMFEAFNDHNSDDQLDIHCYREVPMNSHIARRVCRPVFVDTATSGAGRDFASTIAQQCLDPRGGCPLTDGATGIAGLAAQQSLGNLPAMGKRLDDEMRRLVRENNDVAKAFAAYEGKRLEYFEALERREGRRSRRRHGSAD